MIVSRPAYPNILDYTDYREFLREYVEFKKAKSSSWSLGAWARVLGLSGAAHLSMIIRGQRSPSLKLIERLCGYFGFAPREAGYFKELIRITKVAQPNPRLLIYALKGLSRYEECVAGVETQDLRFDWAAGAIRELCKLDDFKEDPEWISRRLRERISAERTIQLVDQMLALGWLGRTEDGKLVPETKVAPLKSPDRGVLRQYHREVLGLADEAFDLPVDKRGFFNSTVAIRRDRVEEALTMIRRFQDEFASRLECAEPGAEEVYQLQIQFFGLTTES